jgi:hypothetical protein
MVKTKTNGDVPVAAIRKIVEHLYQDEMLHYEAMLEDGDGGERNHVFRSVKRVAKWLGDNRAA